MSNNKNCVADEEYIVSMKNIIAVSDPSKFYRFLMNKDDYHDITRRQIINARNRHDNSPILVPCGALTKKEIEAYESVVDVYVKHICVTLRAGYIGDWLYPITGEDGDYYLFQDPHNDTLRKIYDHGGDAWKYHFSTWDLYEIMIKEFQTKYNTRARPWVIPRLRLLLFARSRATTSLFYKDDFPLDLFKVILRYAFPIPFVFIK